MDTRVRDDKAMNDSRSTVSHALTDFYEEPGGDGPGAFSAEGFHAAIREEIMRNRVVVDETRPAAGKGLLFPFLMLVFSLVFAAGALALSLRSYQVDKEKLFSSPSALYSTESLLIETLRRHSNLDITQRDILIAEYQQRSRLREEYAQALQLAAAPGLAPTPAAGTPNDAGATIELETPVKPRVAASEAALQTLSLNSSLDPYYAEELHKTLFAVAQDLNGSGTEMASQSLAELETTLGKSTGPDSQPLESARNIAKALSASLDRVKKISLPATSNQDSVISVLEDARKEKVALMERVLSLEGENAQLSRKVEDTASALRSGKGPGGGAVPAADFLGTVSVVEGDKVLVDIAQSAQPRAGALVILFRPADGGRGSLIAIAKITSFKASTAELSIQSHIAEDGSPQVFDAAYIGRL
jgi:hypothetical protein